MKFTLSDCATLAGGWSLRPDQMCRALNEMDWDKALKRAEDYDMPNAGMVDVLEFGAGKGTDALARILQLKGIYFNYVTYERNQKYKPQHPDITCKMYNQVPDYLDIFPPDLVIIDGPNGEERARWPELLAPHVGTGTILVFDDFDHYPAFAEALDAHLDYEVVEHVNLGKPRGKSRVCWKTVRIK